MRPLQGDGAGPDLCCPGGLFSGFLGEGDAITRAIQDARQLLHGHSGALESSLSNPYRVKVSDTPAVELLGSDPRLDGKVLGPVDTAELQSPEMGQCRKAEHVLSMLEMCHTGLYPQLSPPPTLWVLAHTSGEQEGMAGSPVTLPGHSMDVGRRVWEKPALHTEQDSWGRLCSDTRVAQENGDPRHWVPELFCHDTASQMACLRVGNVGPSPREKVPCQ